MDSENIKTNEENHKENDWYVDLKKVTYDIALGALLNALWGPGGKEVQKGGDLCVCVDDSLLHSRNEHNIVKQLNINLKSHICSHVLWKMVTVYEGQEVYYLWCIRVLSD